MGNKTAEVGELQNAISCMRDQQMYLLRALQECTAIISTEMTQTQRRWKDYNARHDQAGTDRYVQAGSDCTQHVLRECFGKFSDVCLHCARALIRSRLMNGSSMFYCRRLGQTGSDASCVFASSSMTFHSTLQLRS